MRLKKAKIKPINKPNGFEFITGNKSIGFPIDIFPDDIQYIIKELERNAGFEPQVIGSGLLFAVSTIIGNNRTIQVKETWKDTPNIWVAIVGKRGTMKTPTISYALKPLMSDEKEFAKRFNEDLAQFYKTDKKTREDINKPRRRQRFSNDTTVEGLIQSMEHNSNGMGIYKDELNGFFDEMNRYKSGGNLEFYLSAFSGGTYIKNRKSYDPQTVNDIFLSMLGSIQPEVLKAISASQINNGMIDRWLYVISSDKIKHTTLDEIDSFITDSYRMKLSSIINDCNTYSEIHWAEGAREAFLSGVNEMEDMMEDDNTDEHIVTYLSKMKTYFARFVIILSVIDGTTIAGIDQINKAKMLVAYFISTAIDIFIGFENQLSIDSIFEIEKAKSKKSKILALAKHLPNLSNTDIAKHSNASRQYVITCKQV